MRSSDRIAANREDMDRVFELFPRLHERRDQKAGTMSGGEQQMCAIGRALMARPKLLLLDEPSLGLAPIFVERIFEIIHTINEQGTSILLVEQNALMALDAAHRGYVIETGNIVLADDAKALKTNEQVRKTYLGRLGRLARPGGCVTPVPPATSGTRRPRRRGRDRGCGRHCDRRVVRGPREQVLGGSDVDEPASAAEAPDRDQQVRHDGVPGDQHADHHP